MARGEGQIIPRGTARDGRTPAWQVRVFLGRDANGKKRYVYRTVHGSEREARKVLRELLAERDKGTLVQESKDTVATYLMRWLETHKAAVKERTFNNDSDMLKRYIIPSLGPIRLTKLRPLDIQETYAELQQTRGLSGSTIRRAHAVLHNALRQAVKWQLIRQNPAELVDLPKAETTEMKALKPEEAERFLEACAGDRYGTLFMFLLTTGVRPSEAYGLLWDEVDLANGTIYIRRVLTRPRSGGWKFESPKTKSGIRSVVMPKETVEALREWKREQNAIILASGGNYHNHGLVFAAENGEPLQERNIIQRHFKPVLRAAGLDENIRLYDLRHSYATLALMAGVPVKVVSSNLGHADISLTLKVYSHVFAEMKEEAALKLNDFLFSKSSYKKRVR
ncbi:MAG: site-specific integrase [Alicyclobacillus sp.]|nr:site-specific integrase [Alicyclobacillus sp.]